MLPWPCAGSLGRHEAWRGGADHVVGEEAAKTGLEKADHVMRQTANKKRCEMEDQTIEKKATHPQGY